MILTKFWVVKDPGPKSQLGDICMHMPSFEYFMNYLRGTEAVGGPRRVEEENHVIHTDEASAKLDAEGRMRLFGEMRERMGSHRYNLEQQAALSIAEARA